MTFRGGALDVVLTLPARLAASAGSASRAAKLLILARNVLLFILQDRHALLRRPLAPETPAPPSGSLDQGQRVQGGKAMAVGLPGMKRRADSDSADFLRQAYCEEYGPPGLPDNKNVPSPALILKGASSR